jgi:hypothetical protein
MPQHRTPRVRPVGDPVASPVGRPAVALRAALALLLSGCGWFSGEAEPRAASPTPAPVVTEPTSSPVEVVGGPEDVEVGEPQAPVDPGSGSYFVSQLYPVSGPALEQPVLVRVQLDNAVPQETPLVVASRQDDGPWSFLEARLDTDRRHVEFITSDLATFGVLAVDSGSVRSAWTQALDAALERDAARPGGVEAPTCESTTRARQDGVFRARGWQRETVGWCFDILGDQRLLRVTNLRGVPVRVTAPGAEDNGLTGEQARARLPWPAWLEALGDGTPSGGPAAPPEAALAGTDTFVPPGRTLSVDVDLEPGETLVLTAADDERGRAVQLLHSLARASSDQVRRFGVAQPDPAQVFTSWVEQRSCRRALDATGDDLAGALVRGCLGERSLRRAFDSAGLLLLPVLRQGQTGSDVAERLTTLTRAAGTVEQRIQVLRDEPDFSELVGRYRSEGRTLRIDRDGLVTESVSLDGAPVIALTYQLGEPTTEGGRSEASATLRTVDVSSRRQLSGAVPQVGGTGTLVLEQGVVTSPYLQGGYCSPAAQGACTP